MSDIHEVAGNAGIVNTVVPDGTTVDVRLGDTVRLPLSVVQPVHNMIESVRWHFVYATSIIDGPQSITIDLQDQTAIDVIFESINIGTGAIVVTAAEFFLQGEWYPATVTQGAVRIVRVMPPVVDTVAGDLEKVE
jgi:hypothetical protein